MQCIQCWPGTSVNISPSTDTTKGKPSSCSLNNAWKNVAGSLSCSLKHTQAYAKEAHTLFTIIQTANACGVCFQNYNNQVNWHRGILVLVFCPLDKCHCYSICVRRRAWQDSILRFSITIFCLHLCLIFLPLKNISISTAFNFYIYTQTNLHNLATWKENRPFTQCVPSQNWIKNKKHSVLGTLWSDRSA